MTAQGIYPKEPRHSEKLLISEYLSYDPETGVFTWKKSPGGGVKVGDVAGSIHTDGYLRIALNRRQYKGQNVAWFLHYGVWPPLIVDHENRKRSDNRIANLRLASKSQNSANSVKQTKRSSRFKGVTLLKRIGKWQAQIRFNGTSYYLGIFDEEEAAAEAYRAKAKEFFGVFSSEAAA
jgi:hypothetical protein